MNESKANPNSGLKWFIAALIVVIAVGVLAVTCPTSDDHRRAIAQVSRDWVQSQQMELTGNKMADAVINEALKWVAGEGTHLALEQLLTVDNYVVCSVGRISVTGEPHVVSVGVLNHVFTYDSDELQQLFSD